MTATARRRASTLLTYLCALCSSSFYGAYRDPQFLGDLGLGELLPRQLYNLVLALRQHHAQLLAQSELREFPFGCVAGTRLVGRFVRHPIRLNGRLMTPLGDVVRDAAQKVRLTLPGWTERLVRLPIGEANDRRGGSASKSVVPSSSRAPSMRGNRLICEANQPDNASAADRRTSGLRAFSICTPLSAGMALKYRRKASHIARSTLPWLRLASSIAVSSREKELQLHDLVASKVVDSHFVPGSRDAARVYCSSLAGAVVGPVRYCPGGTAGCRGRGWIGSGRPAHGPRPEGAKIISVGGLGQVPKVS